MQQEQKQASQDEYQQVAEHLWQQLRRQKPGTFSDPHLESLDAEEAILLLHTAILPHAKAFRSSYQQHPWFVLIIFLAPLLQSVVGFKDENAFFLFLAVVFVIVAIGAVLWPGSGNVKRNLRPLLPRLLPNCHTTAVLPALLDFSVWMDIPNQPNVNQLLHQITAQLLLRAGDKELLQILTEERRVLLRSLCGRDYLPAELAVAGLLALGSVKDQPTRAIAQRLLKTRPECRDAAQTFLDTVR